MHTSSTLLAAMAMATAACTAIGAGNETLTQEGSAPTCAAADDIRGESCDATAVDYRCASREDQFCGLEGDDRNELMLCQDPDGDGTGSWVSAGCGCSCAPAADEPQDDDATCDATCPGGRTFDDPGTLYQGVCGEVIDGLGAGGSCIRWTCTDEGTWVSDGSACAGHPGDDAACLCVDGIDARGAAASASCGGSVCGLEEKVVRCDGPQLWVHTATACTVGCPAGDRDKDTICDADDACPDATGEDCTDPVDPAGACDDRGGDPDGDQICSDVDDCPNDFGESCGGGGDGGGGGSCTDGTWQCSGNASQKCIGGDWQTYHTSARGCTDGGDACGPSWSCQCSAYGYDTQYGC